MVKATLYRHDYLVCPWCGGASGQRVDHLYGKATTFGPWHCSECRQAFGGTVGDGNQVEASKVDGGPQLVDGLALLKLTTTEGPIYFVMTDARLTSSDDAEAQRTASYGFEEGSCPVDWLKNCVCVIEDGDTDPHGIMEFVRRVDVDKDFAVHDDIALQLLFPEAFPAEVIIDLQANHNPNLIGSTPVQKPDTPSGPKARA